MFTVGLIARVNIRSFYKGRVSHVTLLYTDGSRRSTWLSHLTVIDYLLLPGGEFTTVEKVDGGFHWQIEFRSGKTLI